MSTASRLAPGAYGPFAAFAAPAVMVAGRCGSDIRRAHRGGQPQHHDRTRDADRARGTSGWNIQAVQPPRDLGSNEPLVTRHTVTVPQEAAPTRPSFTRNSIQDARYTRTRESRTMSERCLKHRSRSSRATSVDGVRIDLRQPVRRLEANLPYGYESRRPRDRAGPRRHDAPTDYRGAASEPRQEGPSDDGSHQQP
jgi:hypothetical protein